MDLFHKQMHVSMRWFLEDCALVKNQSTCLCEYREGTQKAC